MNDDLFLKIMDGEVDADIVYEDEHCVGFRDINPQAPVHVLFVPREHIRTLNDLEEKHSELMGRLYLAATRYAVEANIAEEGYRTVMNCGPAGGQSVYHIHLHLLGGRQLGWPPG